MDGISVYSEDARTTWVPNEFIDYYMPCANGMFVKVYIYLLRCLTAPGAGFGISAIADALEETEKDILRALRYWEKEQVLSFYFQCLIWHFGCIMEIPPLQIFRWNNMKDMEYSRWQRIHIFHCFFQWRISVF